MLKCKNSEIKVNMKISNNEIKSNSKQIKN